MTSSITQPEKIPELIIVMGVSGAGKSTIAEALANALEATYLDGDYYHPQENIAKMARGEPLDDDDRWPWLKQVAREMVQRVRKKADNEAKVVITACSALKRVYRRHLTVTAGQPILFVYLVGDEAVIAKRMAARQGHFMPPSLLQSQLATVEPPSEDEYAIAVGIEGSTDKIVSDILREISNR